MLDDERLAEFNQSADPSTHRRKNSVRTTRATAVRVIDRFGDYGYCGLYIEQNDLREGLKLVHYCFSCRILGMKVETWLYRRLGRPPITIVGETQSKLDDDTEAIDWIEVGRAEPDLKIAAPAAQASPATGTRILLSGGCELTAVAHYLNLAAESVIGEYAFVRDHIGVRREHSVFLRYAIDGLSAEAKASFYELGFRPEDFHNQLFDNCGDDGVWIFGFWADASFSLYRHKTLGTRIPFNAYPAVVGVADLTTVQEHQIDPKFKDHWIVPALRVLARDYVREGPIGEELFKSNVTAILDRIPSTAKVLIIGCNEHYRDAAGVPTVLRWRADVNNWCSDLVSAFANVSLLDIQSFIKSENDFDSRDPNHFHRLVYFRIYQEIAARISAYRGA